MRILVLFAIIAFLYGCCGSATPSAGGSCSYGTYGSACTAICDSHPEIQNCFTTCMDGVRSEGLGDATTCCKQTFRMWCDSMCSDLEARTGGGEKEDCMQECTGTVDVVGVPMDSCYVPL